MNEATKRLKKIGLTATQAAYYLGVDFRELMDALDQDETPLWLDYCLESMESEDSEIFEYFNLGGQLKGITWTVKTARQMIPILIENAIKNQTITYGVLDNELKKRHPDRLPTGKLPKMGLPLGAIAEVIDETRQEAKDKTSNVDKIFQTMPPIEALVIRKDTQLPGKGINGFLESYLEAIGIHNPEELIKNDREGIVKRIQNDVFAWRDWDILLELAKD
jgi:hypothetical protein